MGKKYFLCGIGGSGMSAIAKILKEKGNEVVGSDRNPESKAVADLRKMGIKVYPQDGNHIKIGIGEFIASAAVEDTVPDMVAAKSLGLKVKRRAEALADLLHQGKGIAVAGTSGKTTTTAMLAHILKEAGKDPNVINGGIMLNYNSNALTGAGELVVVEADESDGSIALYNPEIAVVTNISLDHKPLEELRVLFKGFVERAKFGAVLNADCEETAALVGANANVMTFSVEGRKATVGAEDIKIGRDNISFKIKGVDFVLNLIGRHNVANAVAAVATALMAGVSVEASAAALRSFKGVHRRLEMVGEAADITVLDDFAHNPAKVRASLMALKEAYKGYPLIVVFQPHGFAPTKLMKNELVAAFSDILIKEDRVIFLDIFYAGGTVDKDISSADIVEILKDKDVHALYSTSRKWAAKYIRDRGKKPSLAVVMGARDETLTDLAKNIVTVLQKGEEEK